MCANIMPWKPFHHPIEAMLDSMCEDRCRNAMIWMCPRQFALFIAAPQGLNLEEDAKKMFVKIYTHSLSSTPRRTHPTRVCERSVYDRIIIALTPVLGLSPDWKKNLDTKVVCTNAYVWREFISHIDRSLFSLSWRRARPEMQSIRRGKRIKKL